MCNDAITDKCRKAVLHLKCCGIIHNLYCKILVVTPYILQKIYIDE